MIPVLVAFGVGAVVGAIAGSGRKRPELTLAPIPDVVAKIQQGNPQDWYDGADIARSMSEGQARLGIETSKIMNKLGSAWTGEGAEKAVARIVPLAEVMYDGSVAFQANAENLESSADGFTHLKRNMTTMPPRPDTTDPSAPFSADIEADVNSYNDAAQRNLDLYNGYAQHVQSNGQVLKIDYGQLQDFNAAEVPSEPKSPNEPNDPKTPVQPPGGKPPQGIDEYQSSHDPVVPGGYGPVLPPQPPQGPNPPNVDSGSAPPPGGSTVDVGTHAADYVPPPTPGGPGVTPVPGAPTFSGPGSGPGVGVPAAPGPLVGGLGALPKGNTPGGPGAPGGAGGIGSGKGTAAVPGVTTSKPASGLPGGTGASGRGSGMPMAGVPAGGAGSQRGEDSDHERKYGLPDRTVFEPEGDEDGLIDPWTGQRTVPPTIGT